MKQEQKTHQLIPLEKLERSPLNSRRTEQRAALEELKASLLAHGLMQNLVVTANPDDTFSVIAGGRRLEALRQLREENKLPDGYSVPCQVVSQAEAEELSLAENVVRAAMHPADEFEAFSRLVDEGRTVGEIAGRFGVSEKHVQQRMKLARVAPELVAEYRAGAIDLELLTAFTITDDRKRQMHLFQTLNDWQRSPGNVRRLLTETMVNAEDKRAVFVGVESYAKAGGKIRTDLFGEDVYLENPELLDRLVGEKLEAIKAELLAEGWGWVELAVDYDYSTVSKCGRLVAIPVDPSDELVAAKEAAEAELEAAEEALDKAEEADSVESELYERRDAAEECLREIEQQMRECVRYNAEHIPTAGCYVTLGHDGTARIERGYVRKGDEKKAVKETKEAATASEPEADLSNALRQDLGVYRLQVARVALAENPGLAFDLLVFRAASAALGNYREYDGPDVQFARCGAQPSAGGDTPASIQFGKVLNELPTKWLEPDGEVRRFEQFQKLTPDEKNALLAFCVAESLRPSQVASPVTDESAYDAALAQTGVDVAAFWRPTAENFLSRLTRDQLLKLGAELFSDEWVRNRVEHKKAELVKELHEAFADPDSYALGADRLKTWLPPGMAFTASPKPAKKRKTKKAA
jgi:ParB family chromosome partitioning protein